MTNTRTQNNRSCLELLLSLTNPRGSLPLLIKLCKKECNGSGDRGLRNFFNSFDSDLRTLYENLQTLKATNPATSLPAPVFELLDCLENFITSSYGEDWQGEQYAKLKYIRSKYAADHGPLHAAKSLFQVDDQALCESILGLLEDSITSLDQWTGTGYLVDFEVPTIFREDPNYDHWHMSNHVFNALQNTCCCHLCRSRKIRLALATNRKSSGKISLEILLALDNGIHQWREISLHMQQLETIPKRPKPRFADDDCAIPPVLSQKKRLEKVTHICEPMQKPQMKHSRLEFVVEDKSIWRKKRRSPTTYSATELDNVVSLAEMLSGPVTISQRLRTILAIILGHALLQLYNSPWLRFWSREHVVFIRRGNTTPLKPFLLTVPISSAEYDDTDYGCHPFPSILAFGTMLLELEVHRPLESFVSSGALVDEASANYTWTLAMEVFKKQKAYMPREYCKAVEACLDINFGYVGDEEYDEEEEDFRRLIYERIVKPLEDQLEISFQDKADAIDEIAPTIDISNFRSLVPLSREVAQFQPGYLLFHRPSSPPLTNVPGFSISEELLDAESPSTRSVRSNSPSSRRAKSPLARIRSGSSIGSDTLDASLSSSNFELFDDHFGSSSNENGSVTDKWFRDLNPVKELLHSPSSSRVKVAILDTGIDRKHQDIFAVADRIIDVRTWANRAKGAPDFDGGDFHGHGTHVASIVLDVAEHADIYIAKVTQDGQLRDTDSVAEAIGFAATQWKVDIITMSFGFPNRIASIESAIRDAKCLVFAAAANHGGNDDCAYPAKQDGVIGVHSTDGRGNASGFNPPPLKQSDNFSIVGEAILSAWPRDRFERKSGTSFATPVAAGLAAFVLEYGIQNFEDEREKLDRLRTCEGMRDVFRLMAVEIDGYQYLRPWKLFDRKKKELTRANILHVLS